MTLGGAFRVLLVAGAFTMTGCSSSAALTLDTSVVSARSAALVAAGPIQGEVTNGHACFWITTPDGAMVSLVWPQGSTAHEDPLRVENDQRRVIAVVGDDTTTLSGQPSDEPGCRAGSTTFILGPADGAD